MGEVVSFNDVNIYIQYDMLFMIQYVYIHKKQL